MSGRLARAFSSLRRAGTAQPVALAGRDPAATSAASEPSRAEDRRYYQDLSSFVATGSRDALNIAETLASRDPGHRGLPAIQSAQNALTRAQSHGEVGKFREIQASAVGEFRRAMESLA